MRSIANLAWVLLAAPLLSCQSTGGSAIDAQALIAIEGLRPVEHAGLPFAPYSGDPASQGQVRGEAQCRVMRGRTMSRLEA